MDYGCQGTQASDQLCQVPYEYTSRSPEKWCSGQSITHNLCSALPPRCKDSRFIWQRVVEQIMCSSKGFCASSSEKVYLSLCIFDRSFTSEDCCPPGMWHSVVSCTFWDFWTKSKQSAEKGSSWFVNATIPLLLWCYCHNIFRSYDRHQVAYSTYINFQISENFDTEKLTRKRRVKFVFRNSVMKLWDACMPLHKLEPAVLFAWNCGCRTCATETERRHLHEYQLQYLSHLLFMDVFLQTVSSLWSVYFIYLRNLGLSRFMQTYYWADLQAKSNTVDPLNKIWTDIIVKIWEKVNTTLYLKKKSFKLHGLSPWVNYTDRATGACWRS
jgi:hypothetical protein